MRFFSPFARFYRDAHAVSAIEFAVIFPTLLIAMLGGFQLVVYINAVRKVELLASSISEMISQAAPPNAQSTTGTVNQLDLHFAYDSAIVIFPFLLQDAASRGIPWWQDITIDFSSIQFTKTSTSCGTNPDQSSCYTPKVVWTSTGTVGKNARPCLPAQQATTSSNPTNMTLPASVYGPGSIVVIDVVFNFKPTFGSNIIGPLTIARSVYIQPRYANLVDYDTTGNDGIATKCL